MTITKTQARAEIVRRNSPKGSERRGQFGSKAVTEKSNADLAAIAGAKTPKASKAPKVVAPKVAHVPSPETLARKQAWAWRLAEKAEGRKVTYAQACEKFNTAPAKVA